MFVWRKRVDRCLFSGQDGATTSRQVTQGRQEALPVVQGFEEIVVSGGTSDLADEKSKHVGTGAKPHHAA